MLKELYATKAGSVEKLDSLKATEFFGENIISLTDTEKWKKHHNTVAPAFSTGNLEYMSRVTCETIDLLGELRWDKDIEQKGFHLLDAHIDMTSATLDVLGKGKLELA